MLFSTASLLFLSVLSLPTSGPFSDFKVYRFSTTPHQQSTLENLIQNYPTQLTVWSESMGSLVDISVAPSFDLSLFADIPKTVIIENIQTLIDNEQQNLLRYSKSPNLEPGFVPSAADFFKVILNNTGLSIIRNNYQFLIFFTRDIINNNWKNLSKQTNTIRNIRKRIKPHSF